MSGKSWKFERNTATNRTGSGAHKNKRSHLREVAELSDREEELEDVFKEPEDPHYWYGPCDTFMSDGSCAECERLRRIQVDLDKWRDK